MIDVLLSALASLPRRLFLIGLSLWRHLRLLADGVLGLVHLGRAYWRSRQGDAGALTAPETFRAGFDFARAFLPTVSLPIKVVKAYENRGTALLTRFDDVVDVLGRPEEFEAVYAPRMAEVTGAGVFLLGLSPGETYERDRTAIASGFRRADVDAIVTPLIREKTNAIVAAADGALDVPKALTKTAPAQVLIDYFGLPDEVDLIVRTTEAAFWYIFYDLPADPRVKETGLAAAQELRDFLDRAIAAQKDAPREDTVLGRFLIQQKAGLPGCSDEEICSNLIGMMSGTVPTMSRLTVLALDELMRRPQSLASAKAAARTGDQDRLARHIWEASRFRPFAPMLYRRATRDAVVARSTLRSRKIKKDTLVFAATQGAMFDRLELPEPKEFRLDRPDRHYMLWGEGFHTCIGDAWNRAMIPAMAEALLVKPHLRRADGAAGEVETAGTPYPQSWTLAWD